MTLLYQDSPLLSTAFLFHFVRNVPALVCARCGEKEYTQDVTHRVLTLLKQLPRQREILHVPAYRLRQRRPELSEAKALHLIQSQDVYL